MEMHVAHALVHLPSADQLDEPAPPASLSLTVDVWLSVANLGQLTVERGDPVGRDPDGDRWLKVRLSLRNTASAPCLPPSGRLSCEFTAEARGGGAAVTAAGFWLDLKTARAAWSRGAAVENGGALKWSHLQQAAAAGASALRATVAFLPESPPLAVDAPLRVPAPMGSVSAQQLLGSDVFSDTTLVCGGCRWPAHRALLAAASPVFYSMLSSCMAEGGSSEVEIKEADPAALELLLRHVYGGVIDVPLALAPQLFGLADRFQLRTGLAQALRLWLGAAEAQPAALCELLPAAHALCPAACRANLYAAAGAALAALAELPAFSRWPADLVAEVIAQPMVSAATGFAAAAACVAARGDAPDKGGCWAALLAAVRWAGASQEDLRQVRRLVGGAEVPGLMERLVDAYDDLCSRQKKGVA